jgi:UDP-2,4-diacetamido-2,4,6-trideoxy-beta-L-altropyranose hydrolase
MNIVFRVDSSSQMGVGHLMRCITLADGFRKKGSKITFICRALQGNSNDLIMDKVISLPKNDNFQSDNLYLNWLGATQEQDAGQTISVITKAVDIIVVDSYALSERWHQMLRPYAEKIMVIDDLADRKHQCDVLLDQTFDRQKEDYLPFVPQGCELLLGSQYALLRPEFSKWREYSLGCRSKLAFKHLLISMGGADPDNITGKILDKLNACSLPDDISITIVMGGSAPHIKSVKLKANTLPCKAEVKVGVDNMAEIMVNSDIAIGASGATTWERCCLGLPSIQLVIADNQQLIADKMAKKNAIKLAKIENLCEILLTSQDWMIEIGENAQKIVDGKGVDRVLECLH